jgi:hypothetical protein
VRPHSSGGDARRQEDVQMGRLAADPIRRLLPALAALALLATTQARGAEPSAPRYGMELK